MEAGQAPAEHLQAVSEKHNTSARIGFLGPPSKRGKGTQTKTVPVTGTVSS